MLCVQTTFGPPYQSSVIGDDPRFDDVVGLENAQSHRRALSLKIGFNVTQALSDDANEPGSFAKMLHPAAQSRSEPRPLRAKVSR